LSCIQSETQREPEFRRCNLHEVVDYGVEPNLLATIGIVTLSQIERNLPITANAVTWDFSHLACCSISEIRLIALNVTTPRRGLGSEGTTDRGSIARGSLARSGG
jgi:hypothetical protein